LAPPVAVATLAGVWHKRGIEYEQNFGEYKIAAQINTTSSSNNEKTHLNFRLLHFLKWEMLDY